MSRESISVVVPVYNSKGTIQPLVERLISVLSPLVSGYEIILVNDGSRDDSWEVIESMARTHAGVRGFRLARNVGQHNAILAGVRAARYSLIVTLDDDLQHPPEEIATLLTALTPDVDVVYGTPVRAEHSTSRSFASWLLRRVLERVMKSPIARDASAFRLFRTRLRDAFDNYQSPFVSIDVLLSWGTSRFQAVRVNHHPRRIGSSTYSLRRLAAHAMDMLTGFSTAPLRFATAVGFSFTLFGLGVLIYVIGRYLIEGGSVPGFPFIASIVAIFSGAQLFALGLIGEYIARIHVRSMGRPAYTVMSAMGVTNDESH